MAKFILPTDNAIRGDQLVDEILKTTGIDLEYKYGFSPPNTVTAADNAVAGREAEIQAIVDAHVPDPLYFEEDLVLSVRRGSEGAIKNIPGWATWSEETALSWFNTNIDVPFTEMPDIDGLTDTQYDNNAKDIAARYQDVISQLITMNRALARMVIALRNYRWPGLQE